MSAVHFPCPWLPISVDNFLKLFNSCVDKELHIVNGGTKMVVRRRDSNLMEIKDKRYSIALGCREEGE